MDNGRRTKEPRYKVQKTNGIKILVIILIVLIVIAGVLLALKISKKGQPELIRKYRRTY